MSEVLKSLVRGVVKNAEDTRARRYAREILNRIDLGNYGGVSDDLLENADQEFLNANYDLPLDFDSRVRRAIDMGFDPRVFYRGTSKERPLRKDKYVWTSDSPYTGSTYAKFKFSEDGKTPVLDRGPVLTPVLTRPGKSMYVDADDRIYFDIPGDEAEWHFPDYMDLLGKTPADFDLDDIDPLDPAFDYLADGGNMTPMLATDDFLTLLQKSRERAAQAGEQPKYDSVTFENVRDAGPQTLYDEAGKFDTDAMEAATSPGMVRVVAPQDVRSIFARFDPRLPRNLTNISASVAAAPALPYIVQQYLDEVSNGGS